VKRASLESRDVLDETRAEAKESLDQRDHLEHQDWMDQLDQQDHQMVDPESLAALDQLALLDSKETTESPATRDHKDRVEVPEMTQTIARVLRRAFRRFQNTAKVESKNRRVQALGNPQVVRLLLDRLTQIYKRLRRDQSPQRRFVNSDIILNRMCLNFSAFNTCFLRDKAT